MARSSSHESHLDAASDPDHERDALARLERLLEAQLAPDSASPYGLTAQANDAPPRKKKKQEDETKRSVSEAATGEEVAFRLFSTQRAPQRVVIRAESTPPPVVVDPRIRDVQDEDPTEVEARRVAIASVAVDGETIQTLAQSLPSPHPPSYRLSHRVLTPSSYRALKTLARDPDDRRRRRPSAPTLVYLDACLPRPLLTLSPWPVPAPEGTEPPKTPHEGLLAVPPFEDVYARRRRPGQVPPLAVARKKKNEKDDNDGAGRRTRVPRLPKRNRAFELGDGTGHGLLRLHAVYPPSTTSTHASSTGAAAASRGEQEPQRQKEHASTKAGTDASSGRKRLSKARRMREKRRTTVAPYA